MERTVSNVKPLGGCVSHLSCPVPWMVGWDTFSADGPFAAKRHAYTESICCLRSIKRLQQRTQAWENREERLVRTDVVEGMRTALQTISTPQHIADARDASLHPKGELSPCLSSDLAALS
jgi:hypothetical protein